MTIPDAVVFVALVFAVVVCAPLTRDAIRRWSFRRAARRAMSQTVPMQGPAVIAHGGSPIIDDDSIFVGGPAVRRVAEPGDLVDSLRGFQTMPREVAALLAWLENEIVPHDRSGDAIAVTGGERAECAQLCRAVEDYYNPPPAKNGGGS